MVPDCTTKNFTFHDIDSAGSEWLSYFLPLQGAPVKVPLLLSSNWPNQCQWGDQKRVSLRLEWPWQTRMRPRYTNTVQLYMDMVGICWVLVEFQEERDILQCMKVNHTPKNNCPFKRFNIDSKILLKIKKNLFSLKHIDIRSLVDAAQTSWAML